MDTFDAGDALTHEELAWELVEVFDELKVEQINELLAKNVPMETLRFFAAYAGDFAEAENIHGKSANRLPNLLLLGYLLRILEDRLRDGEETPDA